MNFIKKQKGQVMVESMVALAMVVISLLGILSLLSNSMAINKIIANQYVASYLASEGIEIVKNIIDSNTAQGVEFNNGISNCSGGCFFQYNSVEKMTSITPGTKLRLDVNSGVYSYDSGEETPFERIIKITPVTSDLGTFGLDVVSTVEWKSRGNVDNEISVEDIFYNWR